MNRGDSATVRNSAGTAFRGRVLDLSPDEIVLRIDGQRRRFAEADVREVSIKGDSLRDGTLIGAGTGALVGALIFKNFSGENRAGDALGGALLVGALGAGLGLATDALLRGDTVVYRRGAVTMAPLLSPGRAYGVSLTFHRW